MSAGPCPLSVVVPAYNEADRIVDTLAAIRDHLTRHHPRHEVLVVDDGSSDETAGLVSRAAEDWPALRLIRLSVNRGKGYAVRTGMLSAKGEWVLCTDADGSTPIAELDRLLARAGKFQVVIGSRSVPGARIQVRQRALRAALGQGFNRLARLLTGGQFFDTQCGFKLYCREAAQELFSRQRIDGFAYDVEVLYIAHRLGYRVGEQPVVWQNDGRSRVRLWLDPVRMMRDLLRIRWFHRGL